MKLKFKTLLLALLLFSGRSTNTYQQNDDFYNYQGYDNNPGSYDDDPTIQMTEQGNLISLQEPDPILDPDASGQQELPSAESGGSESSAATVDQNQGSPGVSSSGFSSQNQQIIGSVSGVAGFAALAGLGLRKDPLSEAKNAVNQIRETKQEFRDAKEDLIPAKNYTPSEIGAAEEELTRPRSKKRRAAPKKEAAQKSQIKQSSSIKSKKTNQKRKYTN